MARFFLALATFLRCWRRRCSGWGFYDPMSFEFDPQEADRLSSRKSSKRNSCPEPIEPTILYFGTPAVLISTLNEDGTPNLAPMSSAWWLGWSCMLGLGSMGKTSDNLIRTRECVINLPSEEQVTHVDRLALTTGKNPVPEKKQSWGYRYEPDKFGISGLTRMPSLDVEPPRIMECPVQMEGFVRGWRAFGKNVSANAFEVHIVRLHVEGRIGDELRPHIDPEKWRPLLMSFCRFFGMGGELHPSRLAESNVMSIVRRGTRSLPAVNR